jgi:hypothetical protein
MKTVVSVTPVAVERDSRTFRAASSMARMGYRSIVFEVEPSRGLPDELPFQLITLGGGPATAANAPKSVAEAPEQVLAAADAGESRPAPVTALDRFAADAPPWLRAVAGPPWRLLLRTVRAARGVRFTGEPVKFLALLRFYAGTCRAAAVELPSADLYYLHAQLQFPAVWWRARGRRVPIVYDAHDLYSLMRANTKPMPLSARAMWRIWDLVERAAVRRATACVTVGEGIADEARAHFDRAFVVVRNAHDERLDQTPAVGLRSMVGVGDDELLAAVVGNFKPEFLALRPLLEALGRLPSNVHVALIGAGYDDEPARWARRIGVAERVHAVAPLPPTQVVPFLSGADVAPILYRPVNVDIRLALPNKFFQAVAAGVPVLFSPHLTDVRRLCLEHELGWEFDPQDVSSAVAVLRRISEDRDALRMRRAHVERVRDQLAWTSQEGALADVLEQALNGRSPA